MTNAAKRILAEIETLPQDEQEWLTERLVERRGAVSHVDELSAEWKQEIVRRIERVQSGESQPIPWDEAEARLRESLRKAREV